MTETKVPPPTDGEAIEAFRLAMEGIEKQCDLVTKIMADLRKMIEPTQPNKAARFLGPLLEFSLAPLMQSIGDFLDNMEDENNEHDLDEHHEKVSMFVTAFKAQYGTEWMRNTQNTN